MQVHPKVAAGGIAGAASIVVVYVASLFGLDVPDYVAQAVTVLFAGLAGYYKSS